MQSEPEAAIDLQPQFSALLRVELPWLLAIVKGQLTTIASFLSPRGYPQSAVRNF